MQVLDRRDPTKPPRPDYLAAHTQVMWQYPLEFDPTADVKPEPMTLPTHHRGDGGCPHARDGGAMASRRAGPPGSASCRTYGRARDSQLAAGPSWRHRRREAPRSRTSNSTSGPCRRATGHRRASRGRIHRVRRVVARFAGIFLQAPRAVHLVHRRVVACALRQVPGRCAAVVRLPRAPFARSVRRRRDERAL